MGKLAVQNPISPAGAPNSELVWN